LQGYKKALRANRIVPTSTLVRGDDFSEESGYRSTCELLEAHPGLTAIFAFSNQNALGALRALGERKLRVPEDISLVMFDDAPFAQYLASPLSVIRQDVEAIGRRAAELLVEQIRTGRKPQKQLHRVPVEFLLRESVGPPREKYS
jgi:LacI family transcriptional regulator